MQVDSTLVALHEASRWGQWPGIEFQLTPSQQEMQQSRDSLALSFLPVLVVLDEIVVFRPKVVVADTLTNIFERGCTRILVTSTSINSDSVVSEIPSRTGITKYVFLLKFSYELLIQGKNL